MEKKERYQKTVSEKLSRFRGPSVGELLPGIEWILCFSQAQLQSDSIVLELTHQLSLIYQNHRRST
jgi:hypothetical protein